jgi:cytochrome P450
MATWNPVLRFGQWCYSRKMNTYIGNIIQERIALRKTGPEMTKRQSGRRPAIDLAIDEYFLISGTGSVSTEFKQVAIDQMHTFLFAGHDTSSSTMCYIYNLLDLHPEALARVRKKHDVFGPSENTAEAIKAKPQLLNELPYSTAMIKGEISVP